MEKFRSRQAWWSNLSFFTLVVCSLALLTLGRSPQISTARMYVLDGARPVLQLFSMPFSAIRGLVREADSLLDLHARNAALRESNARLLTWYAEGRRLQSENAWLRKHFSLPASSPPVVRHARVLSDRGDLYIRSLILNVGRADGVWPNSAVRTTESLLGRVAEVGHRTSRVLLLTDITSRVPVLVGEEQIRAIAAGNNSTRLQLLHLPETSSLKSGMPAVTSGHGGVFPPHIPVGELVQDIVQRKWILRPHVSWPHLEYVQVVSPPGTKDLSGF